MKNLIYYPGFEIQDENWLKFALLYIEELNPIIPEIADKELSDLYKKILNESDLICPHRPNYFEGHTATLDAIDVIEKVLNRPEDFSQIFGYNDILDKWRFSENQHYPLFRDKYTYSWEQLCLRNGFASSSREGILVCDELGMIYMTLLAHIIADSRGVSAITDNPNLDQFAIFSKRVIDSVEKEIKIAQANMKLQLPSRIQQIPIDEIIKFRNKQDFKIRLQAFHKEFQNYLNNIEEGSSDIGFVISFNDVYKEFIEGFVLFGIKMFPIGLGAWIMINSPITLTNEYIAGVTIAGLTVSLETAFDIKSTWKNTQTKRYSRKYLTDLKGLKSVSE